MSSSSFLSECSQVPVTRSRRAGFTLLELLVVMGIIALMAGVVLTAIGGGDDSQNLDAGVSKASGVFTLARSAAITYKAPTRVLINYNSADKERFLRYFIILYLDSVDGKWKAYSDGEYLPNGVFFSPALSSTTEGGEVTKLRSWTVAINWVDYTVTPTAEPVPNNPYAMNASEDRFSSPAPATNRWLVYEFNANGTARYQMTRAVLVQGVATPTKLTMPNRELAGGFAVFRAGRPMIFQDIKQINEGQ